MKTLHSIYILIAIVLLASCEDPTEWMNRGTQPATQGSYINLSVNIPNDGGSTRAEGDGYQYGDQYDNIDTLNHGTVKEYELYNAYLLLFEGDSDNQFNATFIKCYQIYDKDKSVPPGQITHISSRYIIRNLALWDFQPKDDKYYFGVILANIDAPDAVRPDFINHKVSFRVGDGSTYQDITGYSYNDFKEKVMLPMNGYGQGSNFLSIKREGSTYLMMSNAMLFPVVKMKDKDGNLVFENDVQVLEKGIQEAVNLTGKISPNPVAYDAKYDPDWPSFYLERLAAKVEVTTSIENGAGTYGGYNYELVSWCLANVSPNNYVMRHGDMEWNVLRSKKSGLTGVNRFTSYSHIETDPTPNSEFKLGQLYRGYFCESTEYLISARGNWGKNYPEGAYESAPDKHYGGQFFAQGWHNFGTFDYCHENTMKVWRMQVKYATHVVVKVKFTKGEDSFFNYYILPISHFGDGYTPWNNDEWESNESLKPKAIDLPYDATSSSGSISDDTYANKLKQEQDNIARSYPGCRTGIAPDLELSKDYEGHMSPADGNYLGRWGVVRNTWYKLNITGVKGFGLSENPIENPDKITHDPTPLDYYQNLLQCTVEVKDWTVREQSATLQ